MWPFKEKEEDKTVERVKSLKPGESWTYTSGMAGIVSYHGESCGICGKEFQYCISVPSVKPVYALGPYHFVDFGKFKPSRLWFCRSHSNSEIENKLQELDV